MSIDFAGIKAALLSRSREFLTGLFPAGKIQGHEFKIGNIHGEAGGSLSINLISGVGADFATGETYSDLIAVYAAHHGIGQGEAAKQLSNGNGSGEAYRSAFRHHIHGDPSVVYRYTDAFVVCRYDPPAGKQIAPWTLRDGRWAMKSADKPRPLYGDLSDPAAMVIVVEGEKCVDHLIRMQIKRIPITWSGGANAWKYTDWSALADRDVLLFPDHDEAGRKAMAALAQHLLPIAAKVSVIEHAELELIEGWDIADTDWNAMQLNDWATPLIKEVSRGTISLQRGKPRTKPNGQPRKGRNLNDVPFVAWESLGLMRKGVDGDGPPYMHLANAQRILALHPDLLGGIWFDEFYDRIFQTLFQDEPAEWADHHDTRLTVWMIGKMRMSEMGVQTVQRAVDDFARLVVRNEPKEWLLELIWDGTDRLNTLMSDGWGAEQNDYTAAVGRCWMTSMVARIMVPGCQADYMPVFEGPQGIRKSTAIAKIGGKWFTEAHSNVTSKDFFQDMQGMMLIEVSELHAFRRDEVERVKQVVSCRKDRYRKSYGRRSEDHPRQCVFAGTTNRDDWVADDTGARRFWPITCGEINIEYIEANRDQLFAEAVHRWKNGEKWWDVDVDLASVEQDARRELDLWTEPVLSWASVREYVAIPDILSIVLGIPVDRQGKVEQMRVGTVLRVAKWTKSRARRAGRNTQYWFNPAYKAGTGGNVGTQEPMF